jgi:hypothetical protein
MSFIGGLIQGLLADAAKNALLSYKPPTREQRIKQWKGCLPALIAFVVLVVILVVIVHYYRPIPERKMTPKEIVSTIKPGDSIFVKNDFGINFYKKGKIKLSIFEQRDVKYAYEEKFGFIDVNNVGDKFFFKNKTSFIGTCISTDTTTGDYWIMIKPSNAVAHPPKPKDRYDRETRRWDDKNYDILHETKLSKDFFVRADAIVLKNNDPIFR